MKKDGMTTRLIVEDINTYMDEPVREMTKEEKQQVEEGKAYIFDVYQQISKENKVET